MISEEIIKQKLIDQLVENTGMSPGEIKEDTMFHEIGINSLILVELFVFIEKEFSVDLMSSSITHDDIKTVRTLASGIKKSLEHR